MTRDRIKFKWQWMIGIALVIELSVILYHEANLPLVLDMDFARYMRQAIEIGRNHTLFLKGWNYFSCAGLDQNNSLAGIFYSVFGNIYLSYALACMMGIGIAFYTTYWLCKHMGLGKSYWLIWMILMIAPYNFGPHEYTSVLFLSFGEFEFKVVIPLLLISLLIAISEEKKIAFILTTVLYGGLLLITSISSGAHVLLCGLVPVMCGTILFIATGFFRERAKRLIFVYTYTVIVCGTGLLINKSLNIESLTFGLRNLMEFDGAIELLGSFLGLFYDPMDGTAVFSIQGIRQLLNLCFCIFILVLGIPSVRRTMDAVLHFDRVEEDKKRLLFAETCFVLIFIWNEIVLLVTTATSRYHLIGVIPLMGCACINCSRLIEDERRSKVPELIMTAVLSAFAVHSVFTAAYLKTEWFHVQDPNIGFAGEVQALAEENDIDTVFLMGDELPNIADQLRALDISRNYECISGEPDGYRIWNGYFYSHWVDKAFFSDRNAILMNSADHSIEEFPAYISQNYKPIASVASGGEQVYTLWMSEVNPFDGVSGLPITGYSIDLPSARDFSIQNAEKEGHGWIQSDKVGQILASPGLYADEGKDYRISIEYHIDTKCTAYVDLYRNMERIGSLPMKENDASITFDVPGDSNEYIYCIRKEDQGNMIVKSIRYEPINGE